MTRCRRGVLLAVAGLLLAGGSAIAQDDMVAAGGPRSVALAPAEAEQLARLAAIRSNPEAAVSELVARWAPADGASQLEVALRAAGPGKLYQLSSAKSFEEVERILLGPGADVAPNFLGDTTQDYVFTPVTPCRIFDTRNISGGTPITAGNSQEFYVYGSVSAQGGEATGCAPPAGKGEPRAVHINLTVVPVGAQGNVRVYPANATTPTASSVNFKLGTNIANALTVGTYYSIGPREIEVYVAVSDAHVVGDVLGYYYDGGTMGFMARRTTTQDIPSATTTTVVFNTEDYDLGSDYSTTTGIFTVPMTGRYNVNCHLLFGAVPASVSRLNAYLYRNASQIAASWGDNAGDNQFVPRIISGTWSLAAGDTLTCRAFVSGATVDVHQDSGYSYFSAVQVP
jgi:hypothetical protein